MEITPEKLRALKEIAARANSDYAAACKQYKAQQKEKARAQRLQDSVQQTLAVQHG